jgi:nucleotide-binding universal stress UspA family protein
MATQTSPAPRNILLAADGSEHSWAAAQLIRDLPLPTGSEVTAVAVHTTGHVLRRSLMLAALGEAQLLLCRDGLVVKTDLLQGQPAEEIVRYADTYRPNLVVVGAKGLRATLGILLGGVAQQVVEYANWPVLVVRAPYTGLQRVLLAIDGSPYSQQAMTYLAQFPFPVGAEVSVMHVLPPLLNPKYRMPGGREMIQSLSSYETEQDLAHQVAVEEHLGQALLAQAVEVLQGCGLTADRVLARGDAATTIMEYIKVHQIDLVMTGSRGLSAVKGWWLGSVSRKLVHYAGCSALIVKAVPEPAEGTVA